MSSSKIPCVPIFRQNGQLFLFGPNLPKKEIWCRNFEKLSPDTESAPPRYHCANFQAKRTTFTFSAQICPKKDFGVGIWKF